MTDSSFPPHIDHSIEARLERVERLLLLLTSIATRTMGQKDINACDKLALEIRYVRGNLGMSQ